MTANQDNTNTQAANNNNNNAAPNPNAAPTSPPSTNSRPTETSDLLQRLGGLEAQLGKAHAALERLDRARRIEQAVRTARPIDILAAAQAVEQLLDETKSTDIAEAINTARQRRPNLFRAAHPPSTMAANMNTAPDLDHSDSANLARLGEAARKGDRQALLAYLRARRRAGS